MLHLLEKSGECRCVFLSSFFRDPKPWICCSCSVSVCGGSSDWMKKRSTAMSYGFSSGHTGLAWVSKLGFPNVSKPFCRKTLSRKNLLVGNTLYKITSLVGSFSRLYGCLVKSYTWSWWSPTSSVFTPYGFMGLWSSFSQLTYHLWCVSRSIPNPRSIPVESLCLMVHRLCIGCYCLFAYKTPRALQLLVK